MLENKIPTEIIDLPSKGLLYSKDNPLSSGKIEMKYMTAKEEDILTNSALIQKGTVIDEVVKSLIVTKINYDDLLIGDKDALMVAARVLGYGKDYAFNFGGELRKISSYENMGNFQDAAQLALRNGLKERAINVFILIVIIIMVWEIQCFK